jgi:hypothetical protein
MRVMVVVWLAAACSYEHGVPLPGGGNNPDGSTNPPDDGPMVIVDARVNDATPIDAPCSDDDSDGVCNAVDDWPCGVKPAAPPSTVTMTGNNGDTNVELTEIDLGGTGRLAVATSLQFVQLELEYEITDTSCPGNCIDQIEVGWVPGGRIGCPFDDAVSRSQGAEGDISMMVRAPNTPQVYDLRANIGQNFSCTHNGANSWWGGTPAVSRTIAKLCVH